MSGSLCSSYRPQIFQRQTHLKTISTPSPWAVLSFILVLAGFVSCSDGAPTSDLCEGIADCDEVGQICEGISDCNEEGRVCDGDTLVICEPNDDGCLVARREDCSRSGADCISSADPPRCRAQRQCDECLWEQYCEGSVYVSCNNNKGCWEADRYDCAESGARCIEDEYHLEARCVLRNCPDGVIFVNGETGDDFDDGDSWNWPFKTLEAALDLDPDLSEGSCEIWVAAGTYVPTTETDREATFRLANNVTLYGGFAGNETSREERDIETNRTILSGDIGEPGVSTDNVYHVVTGGQNSIIDGFTISGGFADGPEDTSDSGGGLFASRVSMSVESCEFSENYSSANGGAIFALNSRISVIESKFTDNEATIGGGIYSSDSTLFLQDTEFSDNEAQENGGGFYGDQGLTTISECIFRNNVAGGDGGGVFASGSDSTFVNCLFHDNYGTSGGGGAYFSGDATVDLTNCTIVDNIGEVSGGGISSPDTDMTVTNCIFWENVSGKDWSDIDGNSKVTHVSYSNVTTPWPGTGNTSVDPAFVGRDTGEFQLSKNSPCRDIGSSSALPNDLFDLDDDGDTTEPLPLDLSGDPRVTDGDADGIAAVDMGGYEFQP